MHPKRASHAARVRLNVRTSVHVTLCVRALVFERKKAEAQRERYYASAGKKKRKKEEGIKSHKYIYGEWRYLHEYTSVRCCVRKETPAGGGRRVPRVEGFYWRHGEEMNDTENGKIKHFYCVGEAGFLSP